MEVIRFKDEKEFMEWLRHQSGHVQDKARSYLQRYPGTVPIVISIDFDTGAQCWGAGAHIFVPPFLESAVDKIVWEADTNFS